MSKFKPHSVQEIIGSINSSSSPVPLPDSLLLPSAPLDKSHSPFPAVRPQFTMTASPATINGVRTHLAPHGFPPGNSTVGFLPSNPITPNLEDKVALVEDDNDPYHIRNMPIRAKLQPT
ncbi:hypothetical protein Lal_00043371 [Lupinus albus]|nr:hypothetical protein Lal_00043371 [Lupinus albus]